MAYAENTEVAFEKSISEIMTLLRKAGAERIGQLDEPERFTLQFFMRDRMIKFRIPLPQIGQAPVRNGRGLALDAAARGRWVAQQRRQRGRALMLVIKAKMESVESKVETFEQAFLANIVLANGETVFERVSQPIALEYESGAVAPLMLGGPSNG